MGALWAMTKALDLTAIDLELTRMAHDLGADDPRSIEQRRVDLMVDRLLGRATSGQPADSGADSADAHSGPSSRPPAPV
ncbi:MAG TPA: hypothetical protein VK393_02200, partial [Nocardioidaceae bacterium]|nr:hypothetical protein [Nocardioidaceae bacterium]